MSLAFDKLALNHQSLLALPFEEGARLVTHDNAKPHHTLVLSGTPPTWNSLPSGLPYIHFVVGDYLQCPAIDSVDLDFTGDFSLAAWVSPIYGAQPMVIMCRNGTDVCGWCMFLYDNTGPPPLGQLLSLRTNQVGSHCECWATGYTGGVWQLAGYTRNSAGASAIAYRNGAALATHLTGGMLNPVACAGAPAKKLLVGIQDGEGSSQYGGDIAGGPCGPRAWERELSANEWKEMFERERHWFLGV